MTSACGAPCGMAAVSPSVRGTRGRRRPAASQPSTRSATWARRARAKSACASMTGTSCATQLKHGGIVSRVRHQHQQNSCICSDDTVTLWTPRERAPWIAPTRRGLLGHGPGPAERGRTAAVEVKSLRLARRDAAVRAKEERTFEGLHRRRASRPRSGQARPPGSRPVTKPGDRALDRVWLHFGEVSSTRSGSRAAEPASSRAMKIT
jgi:hypothetical protein